MQNTSQPARRNFPCEKEIPVLKKSSTLRKRCSHFEKFLIDSIWWKVVYNSLKFSTSLRKRQFSIKAPHPSPNGSFSCENLTTAKSFGLYARENGYSCYAERFSVIANPGGMK
ncbi:hypothetical protein [Fibrobacter intestinalis]|uniref:hypothetical protein n=1 Tax=Fibrobacter intestinalis TaxID=28122 RepID=UPI0023F3846E|nr:hypothetical protein [Fibrobacter intestinalis]MDD7298752.1 hypothetical protein [Fibrobacter intestinalis]